MATYKKLQLFREHKSRRRRSKAEESNLYRYIGDYTLERPYLKVLKQDYLALWSEVKKQICKNRTPNDIERRQIERAVYDQMAQKDCLLTDLNASFQKKHGRGMTPKERSLYGNLWEKGDLPAPSARARTARKAILNTLMDKIEGAQKKQPAKLQQAWATLVGEETAQQTFLEKIDPQKGIAVCRCLSSTLAFQLRRQKDLPKKLASVLRLNIQKIIFRA